MVSKHIEKPFRGKEASADHSVGGWKAHLGSPTAEGSAEAPSLMSDKRESSWQEHIHVGQWVWEDRKSTWSSNKNSPPEHSSLTHCGQYQTHVRTGLPVI